MLSYDVVELILSIIFIFSFILLGFDNIRLRIKNSDIKKTTISLAIESSIIAQRLKEELLIRENDETENTDGFLKFISDSRDWAFNYIEEVQSGLNRFVSDIEPEINYFKEYGDVGSMAPNYYSMKKITEAYEELKSLLPKKEEEIK